MTYLDYSATTKVNSLVLDEVSSSLFEEASYDEMKFFENKICEMLGWNHSVIFTSGSSESNNLAIKGVFNNTSKCEIITTHLEHSSINETLKYLESKGAVIKYVSLNDGIVDLDNLRSLITSDTCLITISCVNSETGMLNPVDQIGLIAKETGVLFHCDMTQSIGKVNIPFENVDLVSISGHKFYGPKGIGILLKNDNIILDKLIYGNRRYNLGLIKGFVLALEMALSNINDNYEKVSNINKYFVSSLNKFPNIVMNSNKNSIPHIVNFSVLNYRPETFLHYLEMEGIYISTQSACASGNYSKAVYEITKDMKRAETSVRVSLSSDTGISDIDNLISIIERSQNGR